MKKKSLRGLGFCVPEEPFPFEPSEVSLRLLRWYGSQGRDLPWRATRDPYRIWLSEIMLQQTGVAAVIPYYQRFLQHFPCLESLASVSVEEVIELWAGLGYYSRARNLHGAARILVGQFGGRFPQDVEALQALPGIGRSTAGAIVSIAFDKKAPILDGNVRRVLCRLFAFEGDPRSGPAEKQLWAWAQVLTPEDRPHDYAQAVMDLGATLCTPRSPECPRCPLESLCRARALGLQEELPRSRGKKSVPELVQIALVLERKGRFLVCRRPLEGMLGGLWEFPGGAALEEEAPADAARRFAASGAGRGEPRALGSIRHAYSHFRVQVYFYHLGAPEGLTVSEGERERWCSMAELAGLSLHGSHKKGLALLASVA